MLLIQIHVDAKFILETLIVSLSLSAVVGAVIGVTDAVKFCSLPEISVQ